MKIDRLLGIITLLLQKKKVTALYLAEKFEVSRRTINRDIETICKAGIPVVTRQGNNGGIYICDDYKIDKTLFTQTELRAVFSGLLSLDSVSQDKKYQNIIEKFFPDASGFYSQNNVLIDLSSHYKNSLAPKIESLKKAIEEYRCAKFTYYNRSGENKILLEPYFVVFQWSSWYVFGFVKEKQQFKLFKLNRLCGLVITDNTFEVQDVPNEKLKFNNYFKDEIKAVIHFESCEKYKLIEEYGTDCYFVLPNGKLYFEMFFTSEDFLIEWVLSFGEKAQLIEPQGLRDKIKSKLEKTLNNYLEYDI